MLDIQIQGGWEEWRGLARRAVRRGVEPGAVQWCDERDGQRTLWGGSGGGAEALEGRAVVRARPRVPKRFFTWGRSTAHHRDPDRWNLLYRVLWRVAEEGGGLLDRQTDGDVGRLRDMHKAVRRDAHKMKAFVRFRKVPETEPEEFVAWHRPDHFIVPYVADFFADRFAGMRWTILTPDASMTWDGEALDFGEGVDRSEAPDEDELEEVWRAYYGSIFNPARIKLSAMKAEMPVKHWATMPETADIPKLLKEAPGRVAEMQSRGPETAEDLVPEEGGWEELEAACLNCRACDRCESATQAVFGEGNRGAKVVLVGEQPGKVEDRRGRPFMGPAGGVLDEALEAAGVAREDLYVTNAVKHYGYRERDGKHIHDSPDAYITEMCQPWLDAELQKVQPTVVVGLGRTASTVLAGRRVAVTRERGELLRGGKHAEVLVPTFHPAAILRQQGEEAAGRRFRALVEDLRRAWGRARA